MVAESSALRLLTLLLVVQECPVCLGRLGLRFRDVDCNGLWLNCRLLDVLGQDAVSSVFAFMGL